MSDFTDTQEFEVTDDGKLEAVDDNEQNFEEDLTFED